MGEIKAYLYTVGDDNKLNVRAGTFIPGHQRWAKQGRFTPNKGRWCFVSNEPGKMHYRKLWLPERDDERAMALYIKYHEDRIEEFERNIETHKRAITALKEV